MKRNGKWGHARQYNGWKFVVEDTPRVFVRAARRRHDRRQPDHGRHQHHRVGQLDRLQRAGLRLERRHGGLLLAAGGLDGGYGYPNFSTFQMYYYGALGGSGRDGQLEPDLKGAVDLEHDFQAPALVSGFKLTGVLSALP
jgi:hypothetical protein